MKKRLAKLCSLVLAGTMVLSGCGASGEESTDSVSGEEQNGQSGETASADAGKDGKETVRVLIPGLSEQSTIDPVSGLETKSLGELQEYMNQVIPDYNIEVKTVAWDGWIQSLEAMISSGEIDIGIYTNQEAIPGWYMDLTEYLSSDEEVNLDNLEEWYLDSAVDYLYYKSFNHPEATGNIYGLPISIACNIITYDSQLFEEWGVEEPSPDMTFSDLIDLCEQMTGTNPVTGKQNYGGYLFSTWMEWYALCYDAVKPYKDESGTMDINAFDTEEYIEYIKTSEEVRKWASDMIRLVDCCNPAVASGSGAENWLTEENDIAIMFDCNSHTRDYMSYVYAGDEEITGRYKTLMIPAGTYGESFPEFYHYGITQNCNNADAAWEVLKFMCTDKEFIDFYLSNYAAEKISCLNDTEGMGIMSYDLNKERHAYQTEHLFVTDDYWNWRTAMQTVDNQILSKAYTVDEAVDALYKGVSDWVNNVKTQQ